MKTFILLVLGLVASCSSRQTADTNMDPWQGTFLHTETDSRMVLNRFASDAVSVDIIEEDMARPQGFFATITGDTAIFRDRTDPRCRLLFRVVLDGIFFTDQCHGTGEGDGLYRRVTKDEP